MVYGDRAGFWRKKSGSFENYENVPEIKVFQAFLKIDAKDFDESLGKSSD